MKLLSSLVWTSFLFSSGVNSFSLTPSRGLAFSSRSAVSNTKLLSIITAEEEDFTFDQGQGGVRLAEESAIKLTGTVDHSPGSASAEADNLLRYKKVTEIEDSVVKSVMASVDSTLVCTGLGNELYQDPGSTTTKVVKLAPDEAIKDALVAAASVSDATHLVVNFLGGDDLMIDEVLDALNAFVLDLSPPTKSKISFNSLCHSSFPNESATVTVFSTKGDSEGSKKGAEKSVATGEVYFRDGKWYTVTEEDIESALE